MNDVHVTAHTVYSIPSGWLCLLFVCMLCVPISGHSDTIFRAQKSVTAISTFGRTRTFLHSHKDLDIIFFFTRIINFMLSLHTLLPYPQTYPHPHPPPPLPYTNLVNTKTSHTVEFILCSALFMYFLAQTPPLRAPLRSGASRVLGSKKRTRADVRDLFRDESSELICCYYLNCGYFFPIICFSKCSAVLRGWGWNGDVPFHTQSTETTRLRGRLKPRSARELCT